MKRPGWFDSLGRLILSLGAGWNTGTAINAAFHGDWLWAVLTAAFAATILTIWWIMLWPACGRWVVRGRTGPAPATGGNGTFGIA